MFSFIILLLFSFNIHATILLLSVLLLLYTVLQETLLY